MDTDASAYGVGAVFSQPKDGKDVVIAYGSKTLQRFQMLWQKVHSHLPIPTLNQNQTG